MEKIVSQLDSKGYFLARVVADESPLEPGVFLIPAGAIDTPPPAEIKPGKQYRSNGGVWVEEDAPAPEKATVAEIIATYTAAIQKRLDDFARTRNYDGILSAATYATSAVAKFRAEGQYAVEARDATWAKGYEILAAVEAGQRPAPTFEQLAAGLPALSWPQ